MKISSSELDALIHLIETQPRALPAFEAKMLERFKKTRAKRDQGRKDSYVVAKTIRVALANISASSDEGMIIAQGAIRALACVIATNIAAHNSKFNKALFLHTCGVGE